jgi:hypothetical protein
MERASALTRDSTGPVQPGASCTETAGQGSSIARMLVVQLEEAASAVWNGRVIRVEKRRAGSTHSLALEQSTGPCDGTKLQVDVGFDRSEAGGYHP